jgi:hypothetical protein
VNANSGLSTVSILSGLADRWLARVVHRIANVGGTRQPLAPLCERHADAVPGADPTALGQSVVIRLRYGGLYIIKGGLRPPSGCARLASLAVLAGPTAHRRQPRGKTHRRGGQLADDADDGSAQVATSVTSVKATAARRLTPGPVGLALTAAPASADGLGKGAGQALPTEVDQAVNGDPA